ncbi:MAG: 3-hydroxyacyl-CoA dehydrogenase family protein [Oscillospiraceae bacterium]|nr:3-hydroxyacyl-CoA dehydrogenase family protein [Oscillospiraceae bacterium]
MSVKKLAVIGEGRMGSGIAQHIAACGIPVVLDGISEQSVSNALGMIEKNYARNVEKGRISEEEKGRAMENITITSKLEDTADCEFIIECVYEDAQLKTGIFAKLNEICPESTIFASNTSAIPISTLANGCGRPDRLVGTHFFNPAPVMKLVEIVRGFKTSDETLNAAKQLVAELGKVGVVVSDTPGFLVNRLMHAFRNEALICLQEGVATMEDIDTAVELGLGHPMGPFALNDFAGLDIGLSAAATLYDNFKDPKWRPNLMVKKLVEAGDLGRKTGKGWYDYTSGKKELRTDIHF